jgi:demethylmenaquinone methyltransferase / 2-methoxy-6-polyprenyl-1,4-benzoquinol methylase
MNQTHFGFQRVDELDKARHVRGVFDSVATRYDLMNDVLSLGLHRAWKAYTVAVADVRPGMKVLDIAGGTGDLALAFAKAAKVNQPIGQTAGSEVWLTDINEKMLQVGRDRLVDKGFSLPTAVCDAERLPFADGRFDLVSVAFGLRNMTRKEAALTEMMRVLRKGGRLLVLEFSKPAGPLQAPYDFYSLKVMPLLGRLIANDADSYRYLAESIRMHPDQGTLKSMMRSAGFAHVDVHNLAAGIVALHVGIKC